MRHHYIPAAAVLGLVACSGAVPAEPPDPVIAAEPAAEAPAPVPRLEHLWTVTGFEQPEGAALAPDGGYFISNIGAGDSGAKDANGYISKLGADGSLVALKFVTGLDGPAGLVVHDGVLYAADRDGVAMFDAISGEAKGKALIEGAGFPNDMTVWKGDVLVSDSRTATIHKITPEGASVAATNADWAGINGILGDGDRLLISTMTDGKLIDYTGADAGIVVAAGMTDADGIGLVPGGGYLVSSWPGEIHHVSAEGVVTRLADTKADGILQNDLSVFGDIVIVPNWEPGTVTAWRISVP